MPPPNGSTGQPLNVQLEWQTQPAINAIDVHFGTHPVPPKVASLPPFVKTWNPTNLQPGTVYYWKVIARNGCGESESDTWRFATQAR